MGMKVNVTPHSQHFGQEFIEISLIFLEWSKVALRERELPSFGPPKNLESCSSLPSKNQGARPLLPPGGRGYTSLEICKVNRIVSKFNLLGCHCCSSLQQSTAKEKVGQYCMLFARYGSEMVSKFQTHPALTLLLTTFFWLPNLGRQKDCILFWIAQKIRYRKVNIDSYLQ